MATGGWKPKELRSPQNPGMSDAEIVQIASDIFGNPLHPELYILPLLNEPQWVDQVVISLLIIPYSNLYAEIETVYISYRFACNTWKSGLILET
jgi:hypothetical protein